MFVDIRVLKNVETDSDSFTSPFCSDTNTTVILKVPPFGKGSRSSMVCLYVEELDQVSTRVTYMTDKTCYMFHLSYTSICTMHLTSFKCYLLCSTADMYYR